LLLSGKEFPKPDPAAGYRSQPEALITDDQSTLALLRFDVREPAADSPKFIVQIFSGKTGKFQTQYTVPANGYVFFQMLGNSLLFRWMGAMGEIRYTLIQTASGKVLPGKFPGAEGDDSKTENVEQYFSDGNYIGHAQRNEWIFAEDTKPALYWRDVDTGNLIRTLVLPFAHIGNPAGSSRFGVVELKDDDLAVIAGSPNAGQVAIVNRKNGKITRIYKPRLCP